MKTQTTQAEMVEASTRCLVRVFRKSLACCVWLALQTVAFGNTYTTNFPLTENPISEGGNWINGGTTGLNWTNVRTTPGLAFGTMPGNGTGNAIYADSTAVLAGSWGPNQTVEAKISIVSASSSALEEVELRLRTTITAHSITGYEINCSVNPTQNYLQIVRWNGVLGSFTYTGSGSAIHCVNGDILRATMSGSTITVYLNGKQVATATDSTYTTGSPGIGFYLQSATGLNANYGFASFTATDGTTGGSDVTPPSVPNNLQAPNPGATSLTLSWSASTDNVAVAGYRIFRNGVQVGTAATTSYQDTSLTASTTYTYTVAAYDTSGNVSAQSQPLSVTTAAALLSPTCDLNQDGSVNVIDVQLAVNMTLGLTPCSADIYGSGVCNIVVVQRVTNAALGESCVTGTSDTGTTAHSVALSWAASTSSNVVGYNVYRSTTAGGPYTKLSPSPDPSTSYTDTSVQAGLTYYYVATAVDSSNAESAYSNQATAVIPTP